MESNITNENEELGIAIIGMAGRFPGASNLDSFWENLTQGVHSVKFYTDEELKAQGVSETLLNDHNYVKAGGFLADADCFDSDFFGISPREAEITDPQQRLFLEYCWAALEDAGCNPDCYRGIIGVVGGAGANGHMLRLLSQPSLLKGIDGLQFLIGNDKDYLATRVAYKMNLFGPSFTVQTACSSSLVAIHLACQALLDYSADMMLAGGVSISLNHGQGYVHQEGGIASPDGFCRAFDHKANGTVGGSGIGVVALKRLSDALRDGDLIHAVIKGSAINNDGMAKVSYTAPSETAQAEAIANAQALAEVSPETIGYIEAHGTGTFLGDPIEIAALTRVFRAETAQENFCAIGSVKTNIGHLDAAAGVAGLIKTVLMLKHGQIAPSLHFEKPNPNLHLENSPFFVPTRLMAWPVAIRPYRAGVSSFGIGGTNAHVILEEAPRQTRPLPAEEAHILAVSARSPQALQQSLGNMADALLRNPGMNLADIAYTTQNGRKVFEYRQGIVCQNPNEAIDYLRYAAQNADNKDAIRDHPSVAFLFTGQGSQYLHMARRLYEQETVFRNEVDHCADLLKMEIGIDLRTVIYPQKEDEQSTAEKLGQTSFTQPALFIIEYSLARLWQSWGVQPQAMAGHSIGEYVAACMAGVFSLEDALHLVAIRGQLIQNLPRGSMLSVTMAEHELCAMLPAELDIAANNSPFNWVVSGQTADILTFNDRLAQAGIDSNILYTSHAFHSRAMEPALSAYLEQVRKVVLHPPTLPFVSNVTGGWITADEATDPLYWVRHIRHTVRFAENIQTLLQYGINIFLEVGPGQTLRNLTQANLRDQAEVLVLSTLPHAKQAQSDHLFIRSTLTDLWAAGVAVNLAAQNSGESCWRASLPTYPFERKRFVLESSETADSSATGRVEKTPDVHDWLYLPQWKRTGVSPVRGLKNKSAAGWLVFTHPGQFSTGLEKALSERGCHVVKVIPGEQYERLSVTEFKIRPDNEDDYRQLFAVLRTSSLAFDHVFHTWSFTQLPPETVPTARHLGFDSLFQLVKILGDREQSGVIRIGVLTTQTVGVTGIEELNPQNALLTGLMRVIHQEFPELRCCQIDLESSSSSKSSRLPPLDELLAILCDDTPEPFMAYRGQYWWVPYFEPMTGVSDERGITSFKQEGVYWITGGLGEIGLTLSRYLADKYQARLVLTARSALPPRKDWTAWIINHEPDDQISRKIKAVLEMETAGAQVLVMQADGTDEEAMRAALRTLIQRFGRLDGVLHAAGPDKRLSMLPILECSLTDCEDIFAAKVQGTQVLERILAGQDLDFCVLFSSLASLIGGYGFAAYAAANAFMDCLVYQHNRADGPAWTCVNWEGWQFAENQSNSNISGVARLALTSAEGAGVLEQVLAAAHYPQMAVSTGNLNTRFKDWVSLGQAKETQEKPHQAAIRSRPPLRISLVPPVTPLESDLAGLWEQTLGIGPIGIEDPFFELGGHSLQAIQLVSQIRSIYQVNLSLRSLLEAQTISKLAKQIENIIIADLESLPDEAANE